MTTDPRDAEIARLTAELREARMQVLASDGQAQMAHEARMKAEAEVALWKEAKEAVERDVDREYKRAEKAEAERDAEIARKWDEQDAAWSERVAVLTAETARLTAALAESEAATEGALMILVQTQAERDAALAQVAVLHEIVSFHERLSLDPAAGMTDTLDRLKRRLKSWRKYPATGRMAATREKAIADLTREIEQMERADHHDPVSTAARPAGSPLPP